MATQRQLRAGTSAQVNSMTPADAEVVLDSSRYELRIGDGATAGGRRTLGKKTVFIPAEDFVPTPSNGCAAIATKGFSSGTKPAIEYLAFDGASAESAGTVGVFPKSWNSSSVEYAVAWAPVTGATASTAADVTWRMYHGFVSDGDNLDLQLVFNSATDTGSTAAWTFRRTSFVTRTVSSTQASEDYELSCFNVLRDAANAADNFSGDAAFLGLLVRYEEDSYTDD